MSAPVRRILVGVAIIAVLAGLEFGFESLIEDSSIRQLLMLAGIYVMVSVSLNVINGLAGQFSIGHAGFVGVGAYASAVLASHLGVWLDGETSFVNSLLVVPACMLFGGGLAALFGFLVGLPSLRLRGDYLAIVTLGFAEIFRLVIAGARLDATSGFGGFIASLGGQNGYTGVTGQGVPLFAGPFWVFGTAILMTIATWRLKFSGWGRALRALRADEIAASAVGDDPTRYKVTSFVLAAFGAGIAGALWATMHDGLGLVQPDQFNFQFSFDAITMVILGGSGSVIGAVVGGLFVTFTVKLIELVQGFEVVKDLQAAHPWLDLNALRMIVYAVVLIALMILRPEGMFGEREPFRRKAREAADEATSKPRAAA